MRLFHPLIFFCFLLLGSAQEVPCSVTQGAGWTRYSVPDFHATGCQYFWANESNYVVANHAEKMRYLVANKSYMALTTNGCLEKIFYMRDCISEGNPHEATCTTTCAGNTEQLHDTRVISYYTVGVVAISLVLVVLTLFFIRKLCKARRKTVNMSDGAV